MCEQSTNYYLNLLQISVYSLNKFKNIYAQLLRPVNHIELRDQTPYEKLKKSRESTRNKRTEVDHGVRETGAVEYFLRINLVTPKRVVV